jgi:16S rRNA (guanine527-N7)-methyltransferase
MNDPRLQHYVDSLLVRNRVMNLTGASDEAAVWEHVRDSLTLAPYVKEPYVDIGSGGGFPAIPLAIACGVEVTLVESVAKKARFLEEIVKELGVQATVVNARAEDAGRDPSYRERFGSATARAVGTASAVLELTVPLLAVGGTALLQRGDLSALERNALADAALVLGVQIEDEIVLEGSEARRIVLAVKRKATPGRFPRRAGVPQKRPLCSDSE